MSRILVAVVDRESETSVSSAADLATSKAYQRRKDISHDNWSGIELSLERWAGPEWTHEKGFVCILFSSADRETQ